MGSRLGLVTLAIIALTSSSAMAGCRSVPFRFFPAQNDSVSTTSVMDGKGCTHRFGSAATLAMTSHSVVTQPGHGTLAAIGSLQFRYVPKAGYKGADRYTVRVCGHGNDGSGCSTITYNVTVE